MVEKHKALYKERAALLIHQYPPLSWADLKTCMLQATEDVKGDKKRHHKAIKELPCKEWLDDSCKTARKHLKGLIGDAYQHAAKKSHALLRNKKREYILQNESSDAHDMARNPKKVWNDVKEHKEQIARNFTEEDLAFLRERVSHEAHEHTLPCTG